MNEWEKVKEAVGSISRTIPFKPEIGIILGTGLGPLAEKISGATAIPYENIPHFPVSTTTGHAGNLVFGTLGKKPVVAMQGRFHLYEGYTPAQVIFPIRVMKMLGIHTLLESNAAGGINPLFSRGDLVIISDHINLTGVNPLAGENDERFGPRFPDMSAPYDPELIALAEKTALENKISIKKGVLAGLLGPNLETKAEYRFLRIAGADMVCMSTAVEVIAAVHLGLKIFGISIITDLCLPDALKPCAIEDIIKTATSSEPILTKLIEKLILVI